MRITFRYIKTCEVGMFLLVFLSFFADVLAEQHHFYAGSRYETYQPRSDMIKEALDQHEYTRRLRKGPMVTGSKAPDLSPLNSSAEGPGLVRERSEAPIVTVDRISDPEYSIPGQEAAIREPGKTLAKQFFDPDNPRNSMDMGFEVFDYSYREEGFMKVDGVMYGIRSEYEHRFRKPYRVASAQELGKTVMHPTMIKADARLSGMRDGHYRSRGTGEAFNERHYSYELRTMAGYEYYLKNGLTAVPYAGLGYRYLLDDNGGKRTTTGNWSYDRESQYYYIPVGMDLHYRLSEQWKLKWNAEYDWFISGRQKSHFEDDPNGLYTQTLSNRQPRGYGARTSLKVLRKTELADFFLEPFARYWHIEPSEYSCTSETCGIEPNNRTEEYGLRMGVNF